MDYTERYNYTKTVTAQAGEYYVGDPCYCIPDSDWTGYLDNYFAEADRDSNPLAVQAFQFMGYDCITFDTGVGDGCWNDDNDVEYGVDCGMLGVTPTALSCGKDMRSFSETNYGGGQVINSESEVEVTFSNGTVTITYTDAETHEEEHIVLGLV